MENVTFVRKLVELTTNVRALLVTQLFYSLYGGYLLGMLRYYAKYPVEGILTSAFMVVIFLISTALYLSGRRYGFIGVMALSIVFIIMGSPDIIHEATTGQTTTGVPIVLDAWWAMLTLFYYLFPLLTLILSYRAYREV